MSAEARIVPLEEDSRKKYLESKVNLENLEKMEERKSKREEDKTGAGEVGGEDILKPMTVT